MRIEGIRRLAGNELFLRFMGPSGFSYNIQESADLAGWSTIVSTNPIAGSSSVFLPASDAPMRIIRILGVAEP